MGYRVEQIVRERPELWAGYLDSRHCRLFIASDFIGSQELKPLLRRAQGEKLRLMPILLRECDREPPA